MFVDAPLTPAAAGVSVVRAHPGAWFLVHDGCQIGPYEDRAVLRALRVACTPMADGCELAPGTLSVRFLTPRRPLRLRPNPSAQADLPASTTTYDADGLAPLSGCCSTFDRLPEVAWDPTIDARPYVEAPPALAGLLRAEWNAHPAGSLVLVSRAALHEGFVVVDRP